MAGQDRCGVADCQRTHAVAHIVTRSQHPPGAAARPGHCCGACGDRPDLCAGRTDISDVPRRRSPRSRLDRGMDASRHARPVLRQGRAERGLTKPGQLGAHLSAQGHRRGATRPTQPSSPRTTPQMRGNPTTSTPISPHKATNARHPTTSTPISPHKATDAGGSHSSMPQVRVSMAVGNLPKVDLDPALLDWLLDADPTLRWQVERDLVGAPQEVWRATRARIATEGFGARLLALQDPDGQWAGGAYFPSDFDFRGP